MAASKHLNVENDMIAPTLKKKIYNALKSDQFQDADDLVDVSEGDVDDIHLVVVSRKFDGMRLKQKNDLLWSILTKRLKPDEWGRISLTVAASPEEVKAI